MSLRSDKLKKIKDNLKDNAVVQHVKGNKDVYISVAATTIAASAITYFLASGNGHATTVTSGSGSINIVGNGNTVHIAK